MAAFVSPEQRQRGVNVTVVLPHQVADRLRAAARADSRPVANLARHLITVGLAQRDSAPDPAA